MTRCTNCKVKWKAKDTWSLFKTNEGKDCPYCSNRQHFSADTLHFMEGSGCLGVLFLLTFPFFVGLSNKNEIYERYK